MLVQDMPRVTCCRAPFVVFLTVSCNLYYPGFFRMIICSITTFEYSFILVLKTGGQKGSGAPT